MRESLTTRFLDWVVVLCVIKHSFNMHVKNYLMNEWWFYFPIVFLYCIRCIIKLIKIILTNRELIP